MSVFLIPLAFLLIRIGAIVCLVSFSLESAILINTQSNFASVTFLIAGAAQHHV